MSASQEVLSLIKGDVDRAADMMQSFREDSKFTELEKALGYKAFITWLFTLRRMRNENSSDYDDFYMHCNVSARQVAIDYMESAYSNIYTVQFMKLEIPEFNPELEISYARNSVSFNQYWNYCTTRAVILICRELTYRYTGITGSESLRMAEHRVSVDDLINAGEFFVKNGLRDLLSQHVIRK